MKNLQENNQTVDVEKVNKIKEAIKNGTFKVSSKAIADKLINDIGAEYLLKTKKEMN